MNRLSFTKSILFVGIQLLSVSGLKSQQEELFSKVIFVNDSIQIRWAPSNLKLWKQLYEKGIKIKKYNKDDYQASKKNQEGLEKQEKILLPKLLNDSIWQKQIKADHKAILPYQLLITKEVNAKYTNSNKEQEGAVLFSLALKSCDLNPNLAEICGLYYSEYVKKEDKILFYEIEYYNSIGKITNKIIEVNINEYSSFPKIKIDSAVVQSSNVILNWNANKLKDYFSYYNIERSNDKLHFETQNQNPIVYSFSKDSPTDDTYFQDKNLTSTGNYLYRLRAFPYFKTNSIVSEPIQIIYKKPKLSLVKIDSITNHANGTNTVYVAFEFLEELSVKDSLFIVRKNKENENWECIHKECFDKQNKFSFNDKPVKSITYYAIGIKYEDGDSIISLPVRVRKRDNLPPDKPKNSKGKIDSIGNVTIYWDKNTEEDLMGYRVFRTNDSLELPFEVTKEILTNPKFFDTIPLNYLNNTIYYSIRAVDSVFNNSEYSTWLAIEKPDTISPSLAVIQSYSTIDKQIIFRVISSSSQDVKRIVLARKEIPKRSEKMNSKTEIVCELAPFINLDSIAIDDQEPGKTFEYYLIAYDQSGNYSKSNSVLIQKHPDKNGAPIRMSIRELENKNGINLSWSPIKSSEIFSLLIFKRKIPESFFPLKTLLKSEIQFTDTEVFIGNKYEYFLKVIDKHGNSYLSEVSREISY